MTTQINLRFSEELLETAKGYAKNNGYLNLQEFIREVVRDKVYDDLEVREEYLEVLKSKDANTFISDEEADELDKLLEERSKLQ
jgi:hypothetical protein